MAQTRSPYYAKTYSAGSIETYPENQAVTGTLTVAAGKKVVAFTGTAPNFALIKKGDFLVLKTTTAAEVIEIVEVDPDKKFIFLKFATANAHTGVDCFIITDEDPKGARQFISVVARTTSSALYINGNLIDPSSLEVRKFCFEYAGLPIVVECDVDFIISNAQSLA